MTTGKTKSDEYYMKICLDLAREASGRTSPNPMVGAVVLDKDGKVVGTGKHEIYGGPHAEVFALNEAGDMAIGGTLYVNLEPCCHHGKTPPCVNKVIESGVQRVVIATRDPNPKVAGRSIEFLRQENIEVLVGVLEEDAKELNKAFFKVISTGFPLVVSKIAMTLDGKISTKTRSSQWISSEESRNLAHHWRNQFDAIMTGSGTVIFDNPKLNCRISGGRDPIKIIIDSVLKTDPNSNVYKIKSANQTILATLKNNRSELLQAFPKNVMIYKSEPNEDGKVDLITLLKYLCDEHKITSILLEAGPTLNGVMLKAGLIDKFYLFIAPKIIGDEQAYGPISGMNTIDVNDSITLNKVKSRQIGNDILIKAWVDDEYRLLKWFKS